MTNGVHRIRDCITAAEREVMREMEDVKLENADVVEEFFGIVAQHAKACNCINRIFDDEASRSMESLRSSIGLCEEVSEKLRALERKELQMAHVIKVMQHQVKREGEIIQRAFMEATRE